MRCVFIAAVAALMLGDVLSDSQKQLPQMPNEPAKKMPAKTPERNFCWLKPDGDYELEEGGCSTEYATCSSGEKILRACAHAGLRFDAASRSCQESQWVAACGGQATTTLAPMPIKGGDVPIPDVGVDCSALTDGVYPSTEGCSRAFAACIGGQLTVQVCYDNLVFDVESLMCMEKEFVAACGGIPTPAPAPEDESNTKKLPPVEYDCNGKLSGNYADEKEACSERYFSCSGGVASERRCVSGLKYDATSDRCLHPEFVEPCGGAPTTTTTLEPRQMEPVDFDCSDMEDGNYAMQSKESTGAKGAPRAECSDVFYSCSGGVALERHCEEGLRYDVLSDRCLGEEWVEACGGTATAKLETTTIALSPIALGVDCSAVEEDGVFANAEEACSALFVQCVGGNAFTGHCADATTRYDAHSGMCLHPIHVAACGGTPTTTPQFEPSPVEIPDFDCSGLEDGDYAWPEKMELKKGAGENPCTSRYVSCVGEAAIARRCPGDLRYDEVSNSCLSPDWVEACGGTATTPAPAEEPSNKEPLPDLGVECREIGYFPDARPGWECSPFFAACIGSAAPLTMHCSAATRFDPESASCIHAAYIAVCGGHPTTPASNIPKDQPSQEKRLPQIPKQQEPKIPEPQIPKIPEPIPEPKPQIPREPEIEEPEQELKEEETPQEEAEVIEPQQLQH